MVNQTILHSPSHPLKITAFTSWAALVDLLVFHRTHRVHGQLLGKALGLLLVWGDLKSL